MHLTQHFSKKKLQVILWNNQATLKEQGSYFFLYSWLNIYVIVSISIHKVMIAFSVLLNIFTITDYLLLIHFHIFDFYYSEKFYKVWVWVCPWNPFFYFLKKISRDSVVTDSEGYNGFPQINIPFKFSRINHRPLVLMDGCSKCCEINTVPSTCGSLQVLT